jgi:ABC-type transport system involved in multi-copper enzyme maturation permease subunit
MSSIADFPLLAVWYNWIAPLWLVGVGMIIATAAAAAVYGLLMLVAPKVAAIARVTAHEGFSQPLFWVVIALGAVILILSPFLPYSTLGEDTKVVKDSGMSVILVLAIVTSVWTASVSIADEIEGRTALTLLSKPVGRRQFILGKFIGVVTPALAIFVVLGGLFLATVSYKVKHEAREASKSEPTIAECQQEMVHIVPGLVLGFLETMTMTSIAVALSTRLPMIPNLLICFTIYVLGHLSQMFADAFRESKLVSFFGQFIATVLPNLDDFNIQAAVTSGTPVGLDYVGVAAAYSLLYSAVAMLVALLLFEDRDLA